MEQQHNAPSTSEVDTNPSGTAPDTQGEAADTAPHGAKMLHSSVRRHRNGSILYRLCFSAIMIALSVIFCRLLGFPQSGIWRVEIGFMPIAFIAFLWGPLWSGVAYGTSDLIGAALFTGINPFITLEKVFTGVVMGICFYRGRSHRIRIGFTRMLVAFTIIAVLGDFLIMSLIFKLAFGYTWEAALAFRGVNAAVNLVIRCIVMYVSDIQLTPRFIPRGGSYGV